jgi:RNA polymerase sigma factor (sigma-70 family)
VNRRPKAAAQDPETLAAASPLVRAVTGHLGSEKRVTLDWVERLMPADATADEMDDVFCALTDLGVEVAERAATATGPRRPASGSRDQAPAGAAATRAAGHAAPAPVEAENEDSDTDPETAPSVAISEPDAPLPGVVAQYLAEISDIPPLSVQEEDTLATRTAAGDSRAANALVESHLKLVVRICREYRHAGLPRMDLIQAGNMGLLDAAHHFRPGKSGRFAHFASWWVRQAINRHIEASGLLIRLPRRLVKELHAMGRERARMRSQFKREPSTQELADAMGWPASKVEFLDSAGHNPLSLDAPLPGDDEKNMEEVVVDPRAAEMAEATRKRHVIAALRPHIEGLSTEERSVLTLRYGLADQVVRSVNEVSDLTSLPGDEVRRVEREGLRKLAARSQAVLPAPFEDEE